MVLGYKSKVESWHNKEVFHVKQLSNTYCDWIRSTKVQMSTFRLNLEPSHKAKGFIWQLCNEIGSLNPPALLNPINCKRTITESLLHDRRIHVHASTLRNNDISKFSKCFYFVYIFSSTTPI